MAGKGRLVVTILGCLLFILSGLPLADAKKPNQKKPKVDPLADARAAASLANDRVRDARKSVQDANHDLRKIEDELESSQQLDSPVAVAKSKFEKAQKTNKKVLEDLTQSPTYLAGLERANADPKGRAEALSKLRAETIGGDAAANASAQALSETRDEYQRLRQNLLQENATWKEATESLKKLRAEQSTAEAESRKAMSERNRLEDLAREKEKAAEQAKRAKQLADQQKKLADAAKKARDRAIQAQKARQANQRKR